MPKIQISFFDGRRDVEADVLSPRIAVHRRLSMFGQPLSTWAVSDPVSGFSYQPFGRAFPTRKAALGWARELLKRFGENPLKGSIVNSETAGFKRKGVHHEALMEFCALAGGNQRAKAERAVTPAAQERH